MSFAALGKALYGSSFSGSSDSERDDESPQRTPLRLEPRVSVPRQLTPSAQMRLAPFPEVLENEPFFTGKSPQPAGGRAGQAALVPNSPNSSKCQTPETPLSSRDSLQVSSPSKDSVRVEETDFGRRPIFSPQVDPQHTWPRPFPHWDMRFPPNPF